MRALSLEKFGRVPTDNHRVGGQVLRVFEFAAATVRWACFNPEILCFSGCSGGIWACVQPLPRWWGGGRAGFLGVMWAGPLIYTPTPSQPHFLISR